MPKKKAPEEESIGERINPHVVACLKELEKQARNSRNDKLRLTYSKALRSAQKYPLPINSGQEALTLEGVGKVLAQRIDEYLRKQGVTQNTIADTNSQDSSEDEKPKKKKNYIPKFKSAAWAVLIALYRHAKNNDNPKMTKTEVISASSSLTDTPMLPGGGKFQYCGWSCMSGLTDKYDLVTCGGRPKKYELTRNGRRIARKLHVGAKEMLNEDNDEVNFDITDDEDESEEEEPQPKKKQKEKEKSKPATRIQVEEEEDSQMEDPEDIEIALLDSDEDEPEPPPPKPKARPPSPVKSRPITPPKKKTPPPPSPAKTHRHLFSATYVNGQLAAVPSKDESQVQVSLELGLSFLIRITVPYPSNVSYFASRVDCIEKTEGCVLYGYVRDEKAPNSSNDLGDKFFTDVALQKCMVQDVTVADSIRKLIGKKADTPKSIAERLFQQSSGEPKKQLVLKKVDAPVEHLIVEEEEDEEPVKTKKYVVMQKKRPAEASGSQEPKKRKTLREEIPRPLRTVEDKPRKVSEEVPRPRPIIERPVTAPSAHVPTNQPVIDFKQFAKQSTPEQPAPTRKLFSPYYTLTLVVDQRERHSNDRNYFITNLSKHVTCKSSQLSLGDIVWTASDDRGEYLLDYVIERKAIDDLAGSIMDGRYKEQRFRLRESEMKTIMYLIEGDPKKNQRLPPQNLESALVRLLVSDGFLVQRTPTVDATVQFLIGMTHTLRDMLDRDGLDAHMYKFEDLANFNSICSKNKKILSSEEVFGRQLCCVNGVSAQVAETIIETYKNPRQLKEAFEEEGETLLSDTLVKSKFLGIAARRIGPACSKTLFDMYSLKKYS